MNIREEIRKALIVESIVGKTFVITGTLSRPRNEFFRMIEDNGGIVAKGINRKVDFLLVGSDIGHNKITKARELGISTVTEREFLHMMKGGRPSMKEKPAWRGAGRGTTDRIWQIMPRLKEPSYLDLVGESRELIEKLIREAIDDEEFPGFGRDYSDELKPKEKKHPYVSGRYVPELETDEFEEDESNEDEASSHEAELERKAEIEDESNDDEGEDEEPRDDSGAKYPKIHVKLVGEDGNAFSIIGRVLRAMRRGKVPKEDIDAFKKEATSGDYDNLLVTAMKYVTCD